MERSTDDVARFLASVPASGDDLLTLDTIISEAMTGLDRALWTGRMWGGTDQQIIGYGAIEQPRPDGRTASWFLVGLARQSAHYSIYVDAVRDGRYLVQLREKSLGRVRVGAAAVTFRTAADLDMDGLGSLIREARELSPDVR